MELEGYRWKNRLLLVFGPRRAVAEQRGFLDEVRAGLEDRDLLAGYFPEGGTGWFADSEVEVGEVSRLRERLGVEGPFAALLVGKDGGVKERWTAPVPAAEVFAKVDEMPMRRREVFGE